MAEVDRRFIAGLMSVHKHVGGLVRVLVLRLRLRQTGQDAIHRDFVHAARLFERNSTSTGHTQPSDLLCPIFSHTR